MMAIKTRRNITMASQDLPKMALYAECLKVSSLYQDKTSLTSSFNLKKLSRLKLAML